MPRTKHRWALLRQGELFEHGYRWTFVRQESNGYVVESIEFGVYPEDHAVIVAAQAFVCVLNEYDGFCGCDMFEQFGLCRHVRGEKAVANDWRDATNG